jgi:hypothetical protein
MCWCLKEQTEIEPLYSNTFLSLNSESVHPSILIYCLICKEKVKHSVMYCNYCKVSIGHNECVKTWLERKNHCSSCHHILEWKDF